MGPKTMIISQKNWNHIFLFMLSNIIIIFIQSYPLINRYIYKAYRAQVNIQLQRIFFIKNRPFLD